MKKIGVIADPHSNLSALEAVIEDMPEVDEILCAGDLVGYGPQPNEVIEIIKSTEITSCLGNHDYAVTEEEYFDLNELAEKAARWTRENIEKKNLKFLRGLKKKVEINIDGHEILIVHGTPRNPLKEYLYPGTSKKALFNMTQDTEADIVILGHTHVPLEEVIQGKLIINPGSVGQPRDRNPKAGYKIIKLGDKIRIKQERISYDIEKTENKIKDCGLPEKLGTRLNFGW